MGSSTSKVAGRIGGGKKGNVEDVVECLACVTSFPRDQVVTGLCDHGPCSKYSYCRGCIASYVEGLVGSNFAGACKPIKCPSCPRILPSAKWRPLVPESVYERLSEQAGLLLSLQCGGCHARKSLMHTPDEAQVKEAQDFVRSALSTHPFRAPAFRRTLHAFLHGDATAKAVVDEITKLAPSVFKGPVVEPEEEGRERPLDLMTAVLRTVEDPERRAVLHLRYLHVRPQVFSACCCRLHCFRCRIKDFHDGFTCEQYMSMQLADDVVPCPSCGLQLVKGDGCNSITCLCGDTFNWSRVVQAIHYARLSASFISRHPYADEEGLGLIAATILRARHYPTPEEMEEARAWGQSNLDRLRQGRARLYETEHPMFTARQAVTLLDRSGDRADPECSLASAWISLNVATVAAIRQENQRCRAMTWEIVHGPATGPMTMLATDRPWVAGMTGSGCPNQMDLCFRAFVELKTAKVERFARAEQLGQAEAFEGVFGRKAPLVALRSEDRLRPLRFPVLSEVMRDCLQSYVKHRRSHIELTRLHVRMQAAALAPDALSAAAAVASRRMHEESETEAYEATLRPQKTLSQILFERKHLHHRAGRTNPASLLAPLRSPSTLHRPREFSFSVESDDDMGHLSPKTPGLYDDYEESAPAVMVRPLSPTRRLSGGAAVRHVATETSQ